MTYKSIPSSNIVDTSPSAIRSPKTFVMGGSLKNLTQLIETLFANNEQGFAYDPNDLTTLYQDAAGTIPVTAQGQRVGLMKDKSGRNNHASQTGSGKRPLLQRNATTGAYYLAFDGADDFLQTNNIDFTITDKVSLFAGMRKLSDLNTRMVFELSPDLNMNNGGFYLTAPASTNGNNYSFSSKGTVSTYATVAGYPSPTTNVLTAKSVISTDILTVRIDGAEKMFSGGNQGVGNYGNHRLFIGSRGGTSAPFSGHLYSLVGIGRLTTDSETITLEKAIAKNTGVTLNV